MGYGDPGVSAWRYVEDRIGRDVVEARADELSEGLARAISEGWAAVLMLDAIWAEDLARAIRGSDLEWIPYEGHPGEPREDAHPRSPLLVALRGDGTLDRDWVAKCFADGIGSSG